MKPVTKSKLHIGEDTCYIILPGESGGLYHPLIEMIFDRIQQRGDSVLAMEYPFQTNNTDPPKNDLTIEIDALRQVLEELRHKGYSKFIYVTKSLGGLVASWLMREQAYRDECDGLYVMGFVLPSEEEEGVDVVAVADKLKLVVQGELDAYGDAPTVEEYLRACDAGAEVLQVKDGDHSYRHLGMRDQPTHEAEAVDYLMSRL